MTNDDKKYWVQCQYCNYEFNTTELKQKLGVGNYIVYCPDCKTDREIIFI